jgi:hypothetical protein
VYRKQAAREARNLHASDGVLRKTSACLALLIVVPACMSNVKADYPMLPVEQEIVLGSEVGASALVSEFTFDTEAQRIEGHVAWADSCRRAVVERARAREVTRDVPNRETGIATGVAAFGTGLASAGLFAHLDAFSPDQACQTNDAGETSCSSSPRGAATGLAVLLAGAAVALATTSILTLHAKESVRDDGEVLGPPSDPRVLETGVACGSGPVEGLAVGVYRAERRVAGSTTNENGDVSLPLPEGLTGPLRVIADSIAWRHPLVARGEVLATLDVAL